MTSQAARRADGSKPVVGSSRKMSSGSPMSASAKSSRRRWPPDSRVPSGPAGEADQGDGLVDVAWRAVEAGVQGEALAHGQAGLGARTPARPRPPGRARLRPPWPGRGPGQRSRRHCAAGTLRRSQRSWSCPHRSARGRRRSPRAARRDRCRPRPPGCHSALPGRGR